MAANETVRCESGSIVPVVSVIIPARNEEASLGTCLESLVSQSGVEFEVILVDDHSTDRTREIACSFAGAHGLRLHVTEAGPLPAGWTGKNNAVVAGVLKARGEWLLFTDADTVHLPGSLARALEEAREHRVDMLSYSPEQIAITFCELAVLPVVYAELARQYSPSKVSDPRSEVAAANGQYILVKREGYDAVGGHAAVADQILEDVALARRFKAVGKRIRFRYAADAVRTRMYRNWPQLRDGWTKNLALLFPNCGELATQHFGVFAIAVGLGWIVLRTLLTGNGRLFFSLSPAALSGASFLYVVFSLVRFVRRAHFPWGASFLALFGFPVFGYLLLRSKRAHANGDIHWKGRTYSDKTDLLATGH